MSCRQHRQSFQHREPHLPQHLGSLVQKHIWVSIEVMVTQHFKYTAAAAKSLQSCPTLCDPHRRQPTRLPVPGILQARTLEWVAISFSNALNATKYTF